MRKTGVILLISVLTLSGLAAQIDPFMPDNPITMGQGGSFTANAEGYNAFFYNPAGFSKKSEFTLASVNVYGLMDKAMLDLVLSAIQNGPESLIPSMPTPNLLGSRVLDPSAVSGVDLSAFSGMVTDVTAYLTDVAAADPQAIMDAATQVLADHQADLGSAATDFFVNGDPLQGLLPGVTQEAIVSTLLSSNLDLAGVLDEFITNVDTNSGISAAGYGVDNIGTQFNDALNSMFPSGNLRAGVNVGIGYVGNGFGLGVFANAEANVITPEGKSLLEATGTAFASINLTGGFSLKLLDGLYLGFDVRPTLYGYTTIDPGVIIGNLLTSSGPSSDFLSVLFTSGLYRGFYLGVDAGVLWDIGPFTLGAALRDINPFAPNYSVIYPADYPSLTDALTDFLQLDSGTAVTDTTGLYAVPPFKLNVGAQFHPDLGLLSQVIDPRVGVDLMDLLGFIRYLDANNTNLALLGAQYNFLDHLNVGAEVQLLGFLDIRAGFYKAALTVGLGLELPVLHLNAALAFDNLDLEAAVPSFNEIGFSLEVAFRFPEAKKYKSADDKADSEN